MIQLVTLQICRLMRAQGISFEMNTELVLFQTLRIIRSLV
jgi:hypothetical protein